MTVAAMALLAVSAALLLVAAIGLVRMPDTFLRMSATSKAASLGAGCALLAVACAAESASIAVRALAGVVFLWITTPVASHMIGRAAYLSGVPLWRGTVCDDLRGRYDLETGRLASPAGEQFAARGTPGAKESE
jgi:multicomponent Na+:H+ antiporter subunit G